MKPKKVTHPQRSRRRTADHARLAADIAKMQALREAGLSPFDALTAFRAGLCLDDLRVVMAYKHLSASRHARDER
jgi:hypothetical protein